MATKPKRAPRKKNGYQMPDPISAGEILTDLSKGQWILGKSIGVGGFGEVYSAAPYSSKVPKIYPNVIKIEPHGNGPLFVEMHFYMRNCKPDEITKWQKQKKLAALGMPKYIASGSHEYKNIKYRFLVIDRYGKDLWKIFVENNKQFPEHIVYKLVLQILDILEYIHSRDYVHADIKAENLLVDLNSFDQVYLVDFGLACRCTKSVELKVDPKKAHNGTLQYTSRDAHMGVPTQRGDIEILSYNMIMWLRGSLPWEKITDAVTVQKEKEKAFKDIPGFLSKCFCGTVPETVKKFMTLLSNLKFNEEPPYEKFKEILLAGLKKLNCKPDGKLRLNSIDTTPPGASQNTKRSENKVEKQSRKSPRRKQTDVSESPPHPAKYSRKSTIGVVIDKKRGNLKDIAAALDKMDSDDEYDIQILKKAKKEPKNNEVPGPSHRKKLYNKNSEDIFESESASKPRSSKRQKKPAASASNRKMKSLDDSETTSESEVVLKGTKSRTRGKVTTKSKLQSVKSNVGTESEEDIFE